MNRLIMDRRGCTTESGIKSYHNHRKAIEAQTTCR
jgi:hypothetical protein